MILIKYGGHALPKDGSVDPSLALIAAEFKHGQKFVLVHGGGPQINQELALHKIEPEMVNGLRKTTPEVLAVVQKVLSGEVLRNIVNQLVGLGVNAIGLSSGDGGLVRAKKQSGDLGLVGEISEVNVAVLIQLLKDGYLPVISPVGVSNNGDALNLNADIVAGEIGGALQAEKVLFMTDVHGIYKNWPDESSLINEISAKELSTISDSFIEGMAPKVSSLLTAVNKGAKSAYVFDGRSAENLGKAIHGDIGTKVIA
jgi:acetylglutamate kinase